MSKLKPYPFQLLPLDEIQEEIQKAFIETLDDEEVFTPDTNEEEEAETPKPFQSVRVNQHQDSGGFQPPPCVFYPPNLREVDGASLEHLNVFWGAVKDVAYKTQAPGPLIVISGLLNAATIIQGLYDVKSPLGMVHPASLNSIVIALSGERKTTVDKYFAKVFAKILDLINKKILVLNENFESDLEEWVLDHKPLKKAWEDAKKKEQADAASSEQAVIDISVGEDESEADSDQGSEGITVDTVPEKKLAYEAHKKLKPQLLEPLKLVHDDFTIGAVLQDLYTNLPVGSISTSEGAKVLDDANMKVVPFLNKLWDAMSIQVSRIIRGSFWLHDARLSSSIMIQPDVMKKITEKRYDELRGSGYFSRALFCYPTSNIGNRPVYVTNQSTEGLDRFHARLAELMIELLRSLTDSEFKRKELELDQEAEVMWLNFANEVETRMLPGGLLSFVTDHGSKLPENVLRTACVLHALQFGDGKISARTLHAAIQICVHSSRDFIEFFNPVPQEEVFGLKLEKYLYDNYVRLVENVHPGYLCFQDRFISKNQVGQCGNFKAAELNLGLKWLLPKGCIKLVKELPGEGQKKSMYYIDILPGYQLPPLSPRGRELVYVTTF